MIVTDALTLARKIDNYNADATGGGTWVSTTHYTVVVPAGKRWFFIGGFAKNDVNATMFIAVYDAGDNTLGFLLDEAATTTGKSYPEPDFQIGAQWVLDAGEYIQLTCGAAQGAGAYCSCVVLEVDV